MKEFINKYGIFFLIVPVLIGTIPLLFYPDVIPVKDDVDYVLGLMEALRKTVLEYGEFPFWNPWCHGGVPLFANPHTPLFAIEMLCVLIFGTFYGIRVAVFLYGLLAAFSTYLFLGNFTKNPFARFYGACIFALAGCFSIHIVNGHFVFMGFAFLPLLLWFVRRLGKTEWYYAAGTGAVAGMMLNHNVHYPSLFCLSFAAVYAIPAMIRHYRQMFFWKNVLLAIAVTFALGGYRLLVTADFMLDYPRKVDFYVLVSIRDLLIALVKPFQNITRELRPNLKIIWGWHEIGCYIGCFALLLACCSLIRKIRWYHWVILLMAILSVNSKWIFLPGYWLHKLPAFSSCWITTRWRFALILFIAAAASAGLSQLMRRGRFFRKVLILSAMISIAALTLNQYWTYGYAGKHRTKAEMQTLPQKRPEGSDFVTMAFVPAQNFACITHNVGNHFAYEPVLGYLGKTTFAHYPFQQKFYSGEFCAKNARRTYWSPNRIRFYADGPTKVRINSNTGNYWKADGIPLFPDERAFECQGFFIFDIKEPGEYELTAVPKIHSFALNFSLFSALAALLIIFANIRKKGKN